MKQVTFLNISFKQQLINPPSLANWNIILEYAREMISRNLLNKLGTGAKFQVLFNLFQLLNNQLCQDSSVSFF